jgi:hypothetical protein
MPKDEGGMQELTDEQIAVLEQVWENVRQHFEMD